MRKTGFIILILGVAIGLYLRNLFVDKPVAAKIVTIKSRNLEYQVETRAGTVGAFLADSQTDADFTRTDADRVLSAGMTVEVMTSLHITILDGGNALQSIISIAETVDDLLREQKIGLAGTDRVTPSESTYLAENMQIVIDRIVDAEVLEQADIPFAVNIEHDPSSYYGREEILRAGTAGQKEQMFLITYKNGVEIKRTLLSEKVLAAPQAELRRFGTRIEVEQTEEGRASWYAYKACLCAAHPLFAKGRYVRVVALNSGKSIIVKINDRGPDRAIHPDRVIDLDAVAYQVLAPLGSGTIVVEVELLRM